MSVKDLLAPYLNRFILLLNQNATAKLELSCTGGRVNVNMFHDLGCHAQPLPPKNPVHRPGYSEVLKKNIPFSQVNRLQKRAAARAEEALVQAEKQQNLADEARKDAEKAKQETLDQKKVAEQAQKNAEKFKVEALEHREQADKAIKSAEEANEKAERNKDHAEQAKAQFEDLKVDYDAQFTRAKTDVKCQYCEFRFENITVMKDHIKEVHHYPCSICAYVCKTKRDLQCHWSAGDYTAPECEFCDHNEPTCQLMFTHIDRKHKNANRYQHPLPMVKNSMNRY